MKISISTYDNGCRCIEADGIILTEYVADQEFYHPVQPYCLGTGETLIDTEQVKCLDPAFVNPVLGTLGELTDDSVIGVTGDGIRVKFLVYRLKPEYQEEGDYELPEPGQK